jgi:hypothetical protein
VVTLSTIHARPLPGLPSNSSPIKFLLLPHFAAPSLHSFLDEIKQHPQYSRLCCGVSKQMTSCSPSLAAPSLAAAASSLAAAASLTLPCSVFSPSWPACCASPFESTAAPVLVPSSSSDVCFKRRRLVFPPVCVCVCVVCDI